MTSSVASGFPAEVVRSLVYQLPFVFLALLDTVVNARKNVRCRQYMMPAVALVYCIVTAILFWQCNAYFYNTVFYSLTGGDIYALFYAENTVFLAVFVLIKAVVVAIAQRRDHSRSALFQETAGRFYEKAPAAGEEISTGRTRKREETWYLRRHYGQARTFMKVLYYANLLIGIVAAGVALSLMRRELLGVPYYPLFGVILLGELYFFMDGCTQREAEIRSGMMTLAPSVDHGDYDPRKSLQKLFGDKLIAQGKEVSAISADGQSADPGHGDGLEYSQDPGQRAYGRFMAIQATSMEAAERLITQRQANLPYYRMDLNFMHSGLELLQGRSIVFNDPFYYDLLPYIFYPVNDALLHEGKVLVILGRHNVEYDILSWVKTGMENVTHIPDMWKAAVLSGEENHPDIGILTRSSVNDFTLHEECNAFLSAVSFVILIEPSLLLTTAQLGLNSVLRHCHSDSRHVTFCSIDKNCDGLVDSLSHVLMTSLSAVSATATLTGEASYMIWEGDSTHMQHRILPDVARYLGFGTELSFFALRHKVPQTYWYGGNRFPVMEFEWIARQYYRELLRYAELPMEQEEMEAHFHVAHNLWDARVLDHHYMTVEDESNNMFEVWREFSTRSRRKGFVNIISGKYLLGDYMAANSGIFDADPKAIPYIVADYAHTKRNVILRLCLRLCSGEVALSELKKEMALVEIRTDGKDVRAVLWNEICSLYEPIGGARYNEFHERCLQVPGSNGNVDVVLYEDILRIHQKFSFQKGDLEDQYYITDPDFIRLLMHDLRNASYIFENEQEGDRFVGSELLGHIYQKLLPGEYFTMDGKYYQMVRVTGEGQILTRRAADHITGRPCYRQVRRYTISQVAPSDVMGDQLTIGGMEVDRLYADILVETPAYYLMDTYNDFQTARRVEVNGIPGRYYCNKQILRIALPFEEHMGHMERQKITATIALLMNEVFRTLFAENADYLVAAAAGEAVLPSTFSLQGVGAQAGSIYLIEDSQLDIGLLDAARRNLHRIFAILCDYLAWNEEAVRKSRAEERQNQKTRDGDMAGFDDEGTSPEEENPAREDSDPGDGNPARAGAGPEDADGNEENPTGDSSGMPVIFNKEERQKRGIFGRRAAERRPRKGRSDSKENKAESGDGRGQTRDGLDDTEYEDEGAVRGSDLDADADLVKRKPYHERYYLLYGGSGESKAIASHDTLEYLRGLGYGGNELEQARKGRDIARQLAMGLAVSGDQHRCDFCGALLEGDQYEVLKDGRERCPKCSAEAIKSAAAFEDLYEEVRGNMQRFYGIRFTHPVHVKMVNLKRLQKMRGEPEITMTPGYDARSPAFAQYVPDRNGGAQFYLYIENGCTRRYARLAIAHELTHIWQFTYWDRSKLARHYGEQHMTELDEGMAVWSEVQYGYLIGDAQEAQLQEANVTQNHSHDEYGIGYARFLKKYPMSRGRVLKHDTPFNHPDKPL